MRPLATVITAVHNGAAHLRETVASIQAQDCPDWEYLLVDDASTDGTAALIEELAAADPRLRLIRRDTCAGPYAAANQAALAARGEFLFRTDADDLQPPHRFRRQLDCLHENRRHGACITWWQPFNEAGLIPDAIEATPPPGAFKWYLLLRGASVHSSLCIRRSTLLALGGYRDLPLSQDYRLWCDLTRRGWLAVLPEVLSYVRFHATRATVTRTSLQRDLALDVLRDHYRALTGRACPVPTLQALWAAGYSLPFDLGRGLAILRDWEDLWRADHTLTQADRDALEGLLRLRRWKFLRANLRRSPGSVALAAARLLVPHPA